MAARRGRVSGYALTPDGRASHPDLLSGHVTPDEVVGVAAAYEAFLSVNGRFKQVCTRWQMRPGPDGADAVNDHADSGYDVGVVEELTSPDLLVRQQVADLYGRALVHHAIGQRVLTIAADDGPPGPVTSIGKLFFCPLVEDLADFRMTLAPLGGQLAPEEQDAPDARWTRLAYQARGTAIAGGSTFIQRNIVAERLLGLPHS